MYVVLTVEEDGKLGRDLGRRTGRSAVDMIEMVEVAKQVFLNSHWGNPKHVRLSLELGRGSGKVLYGGLKRYLRR